MFAPIQEILVVLATIRRRSAFGLVEAAVGERKPRITLRPAGGMPMIVSER